LALLWKIRNLRASRERQRPEGFPPVADAPGSPGRCAADRKGVQCPVGEAQRRARRPGAAGPCLMADGPYDSPTAPSLIDENACLRFEEGWLAGRPRPLADFLPPEDSAAYRPTLEELVHLEIEFAWGAFGDAGTADGAGTDLRPRAVA